MCTPQKQKIIINLSKRFLQDFWPLFIRLYLCERFRQDLVSCMLISTQILNPVAVHIQGTQLFHIPGLPQLKLSFLWTSHAKTEMLAEKPKKELFELFFP